MADPYGDPQAKVSFRILPDGDRPIRVIRQLTVGEPITVPVLHGQIVGLLVEAYPLETGAWWVVLDVDEPNLWTLRALLQEHDVEFAESGPLPWTD